MRDGRVQVAPTAYSPTVERFESDVAHCQEYIIRILRVSLPEQTPRAGSPRRQEVAGGTYNEDLYLDVLRHNLNAALDIGNMRPLLEAVAKGLTPAQEYFAPFTPGQFKQLGSHRHAGTRYVSIVDDHDHVSGPKTRFSVDAASDHQVVAAVALQLYSLGIPCIYYGTEQALAGPEPQERQWLPGWEGSDRYLREAMFGPEHPRRRGLDGLLPGKAGIDTQLPGFGPFGTAGYHCFDHQSPAYLRIAALTNLRKKYSTVRLQTDEAIAIPHTRLSSGRSVDPTSTATQ